MDIHARTIKWSKGIPEMDVLSLAEKETVCNKVAKQLFVICVTIGTLILIAIIVGMFEYPWLLDYMTNPANTVNQNLSIMNYIEDNKDNWNPNGIAINNRKICIVFEAFITGSEQLRSNEHIVDITDLDEENRIDGVFQTDIKVELSAENRRYFTNVELLRKIHNQLANKIVEGQDCFEGLEYVETVDRMPVYRVMIGD